MIDLLKYQTEINTWQRARWPDTAVLPYPALKLAEEVGEVVGSVVRINEGRHTLSDLENELGDAMISLLNLAQTFGIDLESAFLNRWNGDVNKR